MVSVHVFAGFVFASLNHSHQLDIAEFLSKKIPPILLQYHSRGAGGYRMWGGINHKVFIKVFLFQNPGGLLVV